MKNKIRKFLAGVVVVSVCIVGSNIINVDADNENANEEMFIGLDEKGNVTQTPVDKLTKPNIDKLEELQNVDYQVVRTVDGKQEVIKTVDSKAEADKIANQMKKGRSYNASTIASITNYNTDRGVVIFGNGVDTIDYVNAETGISGYVAAKYAPDAAYLGMQDGKVKFRMGGVTGLVPSTMVYVVDYDVLIASGLKPSSYKTTQGRLYHSITTDLVSYQSNNIVGYQQAYMSNDAIYYSYDGHYFYTDYKTMLVDYMNNTRGNSINPNNPYYNYYQYLSHRSVTNFTVAQLDQYINANSKASSKLRGLGHEFDLQQNTYGINAVLMLGVAINESGWGMSSIAQTKNNLFGHGAVDSNPFGNAGNYATPGDSIKYHAKIFLSDGYVDVTDWRYFGPHLGDKESGANVKYASDPYWGEKAAARGYLIEDYFSDQIYDYGKNQIGVTSGNTSVYQSPNTDREQYSTGNGNGTPTNELAVRILETVTGQSIGGNNVWYRVQTDTPLTDDRSSYVANGSYLFVRDYGYIHSSSVRVCNVEQTQPTGLRGDVNGDGSRSAVDYMLIKNHILGRSGLSGAQLTNADVNGDGSITASDYMLVKNHILGRTNLDN